MLVLRKTLTQLHHPPLPVSIHRYQELGAEAGKAPLLEASESSNHYILRGYWFYMAYPVPMMRWIMIANICLPSRQLDGPQV